MGSSPMSHLFIGIERKPSDEENEFNVISNKRAFISPRWFEPWYFSSVLVSSITNSRCMSFEVRSLNNFVVVSRRYYDLK